MSTRIQAAVRGAILAITGLIATPVFAGTPVSAVGAPDPNLVPNARFDGVQGIAVEGATGAVPTHWRAFGIGGGTLTVETMPLAPDTLFPGSPTVTAVKLTVTAFGGDQGFDHTTHLLPIGAGITHRAQAWIRTGNADDSDQLVGIGLPLFEIPGEESFPTFTGRDPGAFQATATDTWTLASGPEFVELADLIAHLSFRPADDGGENSVMIALPTVAGRALENVIPNPAFAGTGGAVGGEVTGDAPDSWRAFAVDGGTLSITQIAASADEIFPGSPATTIVQLDAASLVDGQGFDHETSRVSLQAGHPYYAEAWIRSANSDSSSQTVSIGLPIFAGDTFTGRSRTAGVTVGTEWTLVGTPSLIEEGATNTDLVFRPAADGGPDTLQIALPRIVGPSGPLIYRSGFEALPAR